ncbi:MAG: hypothetical protein AB7O38_26675 [Pirellulaceae bacterium]
MHQLEGWFESDSARSAFNFAVALGEADEADALAPTVASWLEGGRCRAVVTGYLRGVNSRHGTLPVDWGQRLEQAVKDHSEYAAHVTANSDLSQSGFQRIMRLVESGALQPSLLKVFTSPNWEPHIGLREQLQLFELLLRFQDPHIPRVADSISLNFADRR